MRKPGCRKRDAEMMRCIAGFSAPRMNLSSWAQLISIIVDLFHSLENRRTKHKLRQYDSRALVRYDGP